MINLRELDELKHSVQNASYEQKDPLLIFKLESVNLFDSMVNRINNSDNQHPHARPATACAHQKMYMRGSTRTSPSHVQRYVESKQDLERPQPGRQHNIRTHARQHEAPRTPYTLSCRKDARTKRPMSMRQRQKIQKLPRTRIGIKGKVSDKKTETA
jgi:preprotein translocase subunit SecA